MYQAGKSKWLNKPIKKRKRRTPSVNVLELLNQIQHELINMRCQMATLTEKVAELEGVIADLTQAITDEKAEVAALLSKMDAEIQELKAAGSNTELLNPSIARLKEIITETRGINDRSVPPAE